MDKQPSSTVQSDSKDIKDQPDVQLCVTNSQEEEPPLSIDSDGGPRAWGMLIGGILATTVASGYTNSFGVYQDVYTRSHAASASNVSWIGATHLFLLFAMGLPAGKLLDKGYFLQTTFAGSLIFVLSQAEQPSVKKIATDVPFWIFSLGLTLVTVGIYFPKRQRLLVFYLQLFSILRGVNPVIAFYTLSVLHASGFVGRTVSGMLADRFGPFNIMIPTLLANTVLLFALFGIGSTASSMVYAVLYGTVVSLR
ncbi:hypothetical protein ONZ45_g6115 [Pleurotus djamor]|nr:hypothetical protein ONZ45_g6115 [Pleurotus djamor]